MRTQGKRTEEASARAFQKKSTRTRDGCARSRWKGRSETRAQETVCYILPPLEFGSHRWAEVEMRKSDGRATEERWKSDGSAMEEQRKGGGRAEEVRRRSSWKSDGRSGMFWTRARRARAELAPSSARWSSAWGLPSQSHRPQLSPGKAKCCRCGTSTRLSHPSSFASRSRPDSGSTTSCLVLNGVRPQLLASSQFDTARTGGVALGRSRPAAVEACAS